MLYVLRKWNVVGDQKKSKNQSSQENVASDDEDKYLTTSADEASAISKRSRYLTIDT